ncbi:hypothetical protein BJY04DRAFT_217221 [Aspergillus karnatakaensis]|uniref:uncharacterized protein n=1 Tax=Aspergillus karnatakaensis TaxID=1810916 RepID=UPI003CCCF3B1
MKTILPALVGAIALLAYPASGQRYSPKWVGDTYCPHVVDSIRDPLFEQFSIRPDLISDAILYLRDKGEDECTVAPGQVESKFYERKEDGADPGIIVYGYDESGDGEGVGLGTTSSCNEVADALQDILDICQIHSTSWGWNAFGIIFNFIGNSYPKNNPGLRIQVQKL